MALKKFSGPQFNQLKLKDHLGIRSVTFICKWLAQEFIHNWASYIGFVYVQCILNSCLCLLEGIYTCTNGIIGLTYDMRFFSFPNLLKLRVKPRITMINSLYHNIIWSKKYKK